MKTPYTLEDVQTVLADAAAICRALCSELTDIDDKLKLVSGSCNVMAQAQALAGIECDYLTKSMEQIQEMIDADRAARISKSNNCELGAAEEYKPE